MKQVVLATRNAHKVEEVRRILAPLVTVELVGLEAFPDVPDIPEPAATFRGNAGHKARGVAAITRLPAIADDSGLEVDRLNGMPGVLSARWSGRHGDDTANLELLLAQLSEVPEGFLTAAFVCAAVLAVPTADPDVSGYQREVEGRVEGHLVREPRGTSGFGYDPIFVPDGETRTMAELSAEEKDALSHRGRAFRALAPYLSELE